MTKRDLNSKLSQVRQHLASAAKFKKVTLRELRAKEPLRLALERILFLVAQATIDLAESYIAYKNLPKPSSMHECFHILQQYGIIDDDLAERMLQMVGFRNVLTHGYTRIDYDIVLDVLTHGLNDIKKFLRLLSQVPI